MRMRRGGLRRRSRRRRSRPCVPNQSLHRPTQRRGSILLDGPPAGSQVSNQGPQDLVTVFTNLGSLGHQGGEEPLDVLLPTQRLLVVEGLRMQSCNKTKFPIKCFPSFICMFLLFKTQTEKNGKMKTMRLLSGMLVITFQFSSYFD